MQCPNCDQSVAAWADFCPHCGTRQPLIGEPAPATSEPSLIDEVFADAPPAEASTVEESWAESWQPPWQMAAESPADPIPGPATSVDAAHWPAPDAASPAAPADPAPSGPTPPPDPAATAVVAAPGDQPASGMAPVPPVSAMSSPATPATAGPAALWSDGSSGGPSGGTGKVIVAFAGILIAAALGLALWSMFRVGDAGGSPEASSSSPAGPSTPAPEPPPSSAPPSSAPPSQSPGAVPTPGALPAGATACGVSGAGDLAARYVGANTTCEFAEAVQAAYLAAAPAGGPATIQAHSPVTNLDYTLTCTGSLPTTCTTGRASVYLTRPS